MMIKLKLFKSEFFFYFSTPVTLETYIYSIQNEYIHTAYTYSKQCNYRTRFTIVRNINFFLILSRENRKEDILGQTVFTLNSTV